MSESILLCARTACDRAAHPAGWNRMTHEMYCEPCARLINQFTDHAVPPLCPLLPLFFAGLADGKLTTGSWGAMVLIDETKLRKPRG